MTREARAPIRLEHFGARIGTEKAKSRSAQKRARGKKPNLLDKAADMFHTEHGEKQNRRVILMREKQVLRDSKKAARAAMKKRKKK